MIHTILQIGAIILAFGLGIACFAGASWYDFSKNQFIDGE